MQISIRTITVTTVEAEPWPCVPMADHSWVTIAAAQIKTVIIARSSDPVILVQRITRDNLSGVSVMSSNNGHSDESLMGYFG